MSEPAEASKLLLSGLDHVTTVRFSPGIFVWGHVFQRGDLPLIIRDPVGNPAAPAVVTYTMFRYLKNCPTPVQVGPLNRTPVTAELGEYYVSGVAGENGQPGDWFVRWVYQESIDSEKVEVPFPFKVYTTSQFSASSCRCSTKPLCGCSGR